MEMIYDSEKNTVMSNISVNELYCDLSDMVSQFKKKIYNRKDKMCTL